MIENDSFTEESGLTPKQQNFIAALIAGNAIIVAAKVAGIGEATAYRWMKLPAINQAYQDAKSAVFDEALEGLRDHTKGAIDRIKSIMDSAEVDPAVRLRAAHIILQNAVQVHKIEQLATELAELKEAFGASRA